MNSRKVRYSCVVVCLSVLLGSSWITAAAAAGEIFLKSEKFALAPPEASTAIVPFLLSGPGKLILEVTTAQQLGHFGIVARGAYHNAVSRRKDGPAGTAPLRMEIQVTSQELQKGPMWFAFPTLRRANNSLYPSPGVMLEGEIKVSFIPAPSSPQTGASPPATTVSAVLPNPSGFTAKAGAGGDVILKWSPVPNAIYYSLQGAGVASVSGMPPNVSGTTYTVKGLPAGTHSWVLFAVYSGPSGPYWGDESNPSRTSMTIAPPAAQVVPPPATTVAIPTGTKLPLSQGGKIPQTGASPPVTTAPPAAQPTQAVPQSAAKTAVPTGTKPLPLEGGKIPQIGVVAPMLPNPSGFTATTGARGDVTLKWNPVPGVPYYCLQGPGTPNQPLGDPPFVTATTYLAKGLPPGTHNWALLSGPVCDFTNTNPMARTSATVSRLSGRYRVTINGLRVNNPTWDTILSTDGKGDEIFVVVDLQEMSATSNVAQATAGFTPWPGQTRDTFVYGDTNSFPSRKKAGSLSSQGGLRSGDNIPNVTEPWKRSGPPLQKEFPLFVWEGNLVDGQNAVLISPAIWEQDSADRITPIFNTAATIWGLTLKPLWDSFSTPGIVDQKALHRLVFGEEFSQTFTAAANTNLTLLSGGLGGVEFLKELTPYADLNPNNSLLTAGGSLFGESKDRPIGMIKSGNVYVFNPWIIPLNYATAEASLAPNSFLLRGPGIIEHRFVDAPEWAGDYTLYLQIERVQ